MPNPFHPPSTYHVTYFYLATGMEGQADTRDYGYIVAATPAEAIDLAARRQHPSISPTDLDWIKGCLSAKKVA